MLENLLKTGVWDSPPYFLSCSLALSREVLFLSLSLYMRLPQLAAPNHTHLHGVRDRLKAAMRVSREALGDKHVGDGSEGVQGPELHSQYMGCRNQGRQRGNNGRRSGVRQTEALFFIAAARFKLVLRLLHSSRVNAGI